MADLVATWLLHGGLLVAIALLARFVFGRSVDGRRLGIGLAVIAAYYLCVFGGQMLRSAVPAFHALAFNWPGKLLAIAGTLAMMALLVRADPRIDADRLGLVWRQRGGAWWPCLIVAAVLCALSWGLHAAIGDGPHVTAGRIAYQATLPGLDEELFMRGLLAALLGIAFDDRADWWGARFGFGAIAATALFAAQHGLLVADGHLVFSAENLLFTGAIGLGLIWIRRRSGSLLLPILTHNLINVGNSFF